LLQDFGIDIDYYTPLGRKWGDKHADKILKLLRKELDKLTVIGDKERN
jgi:hypothetical protein